MTLPITVARLLRRAGQDSRRIGQALIGKPDPTFVEYERAVAAIDDEPEPPIEDALLEIEAQLVAASGAKSVAVSRYYLRVEALAYVADGDELRA